MTQHFEKSLRDCSWQERLSCRGRSALPQAEFCSTDLLFRGFTEDELDDRGELGPERIRLPDLSCNWDRFSLPEDVRRRLETSRGDGCYAVKVEVIRYRNFATPVHDPICGTELETYAHVEVRELRDSETIEDTPPRERKPRKSKTAKLVRTEWRRHIVNNLSRLIEPNTE